MVNKVILIGNVGMDPEVRTLEGGAKVARIRLATTERLYDRQSNETKEHTEWHTITLWRGLADVMNLLGRRSDNPATDNSQTGYQQGGYQQGGYQQGGSHQAGASTGGYSQPASSSGASYQQPQPAAASTPAAPADDPDDLPF